MRILFVIRDMFVGGAGKQLALTANALNAYGHEISIYSYFGKELHQKINGDIHFLSQEKNFRNKFQEYIFAIFSIRKQIKKIRPDVVISWRCNAGCFSYLASLGLGVKTVFCERTDPYTETSLFLKASAFFCGFSTGGVFQTKAVQQYYRKLASRSIVIHNPVDTTDSFPEIIPYENRSKEIVHVARMRLQHKRQDIMLKAFKNFLQKHPDYKLSFYGDGFDFDKVKKMAFDMGLSQNVVFHGSVSNIISKICTAKVFVLTSDYEGIPNVIIEAFSAGVPVVATDCSPGGARVLIDDKINGFVVPTGDYEKIAQSICQIVENPETANSFIFQSRRKLGEFLPEKIFSQWNDFIKNLK